MFFICNIGFVLIIIVWFLAFWKEMGWAGDYKLFPFLSSQKQYYGDKLNRKEVVTIFVQAFFIRIIFYIVAFGLLVLIRFVQSGDNNMSLTVAEFLSSWNRWDSPHYIGIAQDGYSGYSEVMDWSSKAEHLRLVFFPMYPWLMKVVHLSINNWEVCGLIVSNLAFCLGSFFFYAVLSEEFGQKIAEKSYWLLVLYPFSFFFGCIMTESLFFCLIAAGFFYIHRHKWLIVGLIGIMATLCRVQGILLLGVGAVEFLISSKPVHLFQEKKMAKFLKALFTEAIWLLLIPVGNVIYFYINYIVEGNPFRFTVYQENQWYHKTVWFTTGLEEVLEYAINGNLVDKICVWYPELLLFILSICLIIFSLKINALKYSAYLIVYTILNYSITFLISGGRYMLNALPLFLFLAIVLEKRSNTLFYLICLFSSFLSVFFYASYFGGLPVF